MRRRRKPKVVVRVKVKRQKRRRFISALLAAGLVSAAFYFSGPVRERVSALGKSRFAGWRVRAAEVSGVEGRLQKELFAVIKFKPGQAWTAADSGNLASEMTSRFPFLAGVGIRRNWINGRLEVSASLKQAVGRVQVPGTQTAFLGQDGKLFDAPAELYSGDLIAVELPQGAKSDLPELAKFMKELQAKKSFFPSGLSKITYSPLNRECALKFEDGSEARWGDYGFTEEKIARLRQVLADSGSRLEGPVRADLRYFSDGKILLNRIDAAAPRINP